MENSTQNSKLKAQSSLPRPPIVVVIGHIDHGKSTLIDFIRKTNIVAKEAGGITQSIGAYEIVRESTIGEPKRITFIDTPGHEAFSKMRARGARAADLAILVVAADDGVKPQTREVIELLKGTETPFIVAINKIDKSHADIERAKQELMQAGVLLEGFGGNISWQGISAKTGQGVDELLDLILLAAELEGLSYNPEAPASGIVIESKMDSRRGLEVMAIVENGTLRVGDMIKTQTASGKIKILENFLGERVEELQPSSPALMLGFDRLPEIGEEFHIKEGEELTEQITQAKKIPIVAPEPLGAQIVPEPLVKILLKTDVSGSLEAVSGIIKTLPEVKIVSETIGDITDGDVKNAFDLGAVIVGFKVKATKAALNLARGKEMAVLSSDIIYELLKSLEEMVNFLRKPAPKGKLIVLAVFSQKGKKQVIGGRVEDGAITLNASVKIFRGENELGSGRIINLQKNKKDAKKIEKDEECGILIESDISISVGDELVHLG